MATTTPAPAPAERDRTLNIAQRINLVMSRIDFIEKEKKQEMKYSIVTHDAVTSLVRSHFVEVGIIYYPCELEHKQDGNRTEAEIVVRFENIDDRSDYLDVESLGYGVDAQDKGPGKAISYAVKYALLKALGLITGDDADAHQGIEANHRSSLDKRADDLELAISTSADTLSLKALMDSAPTVEIMTALQSRNAGRRQQLAAQMSLKIKDLRAREEADQRPANERQG